jgi:HPt (histidine-containing phosphotransfer) domain-containing protein
MSASELPGTGSDSQPDVIDGEHLGRMTLGDRGLERELLQIFVRQSAAVLDRMTTHDPAAIAIAAHTMVGSARGIGAWRVARAAEQLECVADKGNEKDLDTAITALKSASSEVHAAIEARLADPSRRISDWA